MQHERDGNGRSDPRDELVVGSAVRSVMACEVPTATASPSTPVAATNAGRVVRIGAHPGRVSAVLAADLAELRLDPDPELMPARDDRGRRATFSA